MAYERVTGPLGPERDDQLNAASSMVAASPWVGKGQKLHLDDFMPTWDQKPPDPEERKKNLKAWVQMMGGDVG